MSSSYFRQIWVIISGWARIKFMGKTNAQCVEMSSIFVGSWHCHICRKIWATSRSAMPSSWCIIPRNLTHRTHFSRTPKKPGYLIVLVSQLTVHGVRWDSVPFSLWWNHGSFDPPMFQSTKAMQKGSESSWWGPCQAFHTKVVTNFASNTTDWSLVGGFNPFEKY